MEILEEQRENWGTRGGFVLAAIGSAVGLGNLWGFPYKLYDNGGAAFLIPYIFAMFLIGVPVLILEFSLGHFTQRAAPNAFASGHKRLEFVGWWGIILGFTIVTFYPVILAYCFSFLGFSVQGIFNGGQLPWAGEGLEGIQNAKAFFSETYLDKIEAPSLGCIRYNILIPLVLAWIAMYLCIFRGVKLVGKIVWLTVPLPWLVLLVLAINGLMLPGSMKGLAYYLNPDWSELAKPQTWQNAFGQAFFSLSLAFGVMITYASFLHRKSDINNNAAIIGLADFATSFIGGIAIFATLGGMAFVTAQAGNPVAVEDVLDGGPGLAFVAFPYALAQLPGAPWWSFLFFFTLVTLGIDSAFSITESVLASIVDKTGWSRRVVLPLMSLVGLAFGLVFTTQGGLNWLGVVADAIYGTWGIGFVGLLECILLGWLYRIDILRNHANERSDWSLGRWWNYAIRIFIPVILGTLFLWSLFDDFTNPEGFLKDPGGKWIVTNCVGMAVVSIAPIIAIIMSLLKSPSQLVHGQQAQLHYPTQFMGKKNGTISFLMSLFSGIILIFLLKTGGAYDHKVYWMLLSLILSIAALVISNYLLEKYDNTASRPSWFARWAGIIATLDISAFLAIALIYMIKDATVTQITSRVTDKLSSVSYVILSVVFVLVVGGLGWCFWRAIAAASKEAPVEPQELPEAGD